MSSFVDLIGQRFGKLVVIKKLEPNKWNNYQWECMCDCGNTCTTSGGRLRSGNTKSCGCLKNGAFEVKHGLSSKYAYKCYIHAKERCYDSRHKSNKHYRESGIEMSEEFINDPTAWCEYLGEPPDEINQWTVDRIDSKRGYERGNIRWLEMGKQPRNQIKRCTNTSGVTGVTKYADKYWCAEWFYNYKHSRKFFSIKKLGYEEAFRLACDYRSKMIAELNEQGAGYTENH